MLFSAAEKSCAPEKGSIYGHPSTRPRTAGRDPEERERGETEEEQRLSVQHPFSHVSHEQMAGLLAVRGHFQ